MISLGPVFRLRGSGKYICAVYAIEVPVLVTSDWIANLFPKSWGHSITAWGLMHEGVTNSRWTMLINNRRQTTPADIVGRLKRRLPEIDEKLIKVDVLGAVPEQGQQDTVGTPRTGTRRLMQSSRGGNGGFTAR